MTTNTNAALIKALNEAQAGLEFAAAKMPQTTEFVPAHIAALGIVNAALAASPAAPVAAPVVLPEPAEFQKRTTPEWDAKAPWSDWEKCTPGSAADCERVPVLHNWRHEVRKLYTEQQVRTLLAQATAAPAAEPPVHPEMPETWHVDAHVRGEKILSIGYDWLSGKGELDDAERDAVIGMAQHLLAFVGYGIPPSNFDPDADDQPAAPAAVAGPSDLQMEFQAHAIKGSRLVRVLYNESHGTLSNTEIGAWIEYAQQLLTTAAQAAPAAQGDALHQHLLEMLGAKNHEHAAQIIAEHHARELAAQAAPTLDDAWKARMLDGQPLKLDKHGFGFHHSLPNFDEGVNGQDFFAVFGIELKACMADDEMDSDAYEAMTDPDAALYDCRAWTPNRPKGNGWNLIAIFDTEDGPACWWVRAAAQKVE